MTVVETAGTVHADILDNSSLDTNPLDPSAADAGETTPPCFQAA
jgi:hypothetical protein